MVFNCYADEHGGEPWIFQLYVKDTIDRILRQEDSDKNYQVTTLDNGPKACYASYTLSSRSY